MAFFADNIGSPPSDPWIRSTNESCSLPHTVFHGRTIVGWGWLLVHVDEHCDQGFAADRERQRNCF